MGISKTYTVAVDLTQKDTSVAIASTTLSTRQVTATSFLTGPPGLPGLPGSAGPVNSLSIGSVQTGPAGSQAQASLTGVSPSQVLNLVLPTGSVEISGISIVDSNGVTWQLGITTAGALVTYQGTYAPSVYGAVYGTAIYA
jgi:hypothetical protein